jgi:phage baseplate assembly protein W
MINIKFPIEDDKVKNFLFKGTLTTKEALKANLLLLLNTNKGERYYLPEYGTNLNRYLFEQKDKETLSIIEEDIKNTVKKYIPQLTITDVIFFELEDENGISLAENELGVDVKFVYNDNIFGRNDSVTIIVSR